MNKSEIYLKAAELVESRTTCHSCDAISWIVGKDYNHDYEETTAFAKMFKPAFIKDKLCWLKGKFNDYDLISGGPKITAWRLTALCFASAMAETGDL